jgi:hypothetical protein
MKSKDTSTVLFLGIVNEGCRTDERCFEVPICLSCFARVMRHVGRKMAREIMSCSVLQIPYAYLLGYPYPQ